MLQDSSNPYEVDVGLQQASRPGMTFCQILGGIVFGTIAAATAFVATCLSGLYLVTPVIRMFGIGAADDGQAILLVVIACAFIVSAAAFIRVFRGARSSQ